MSSPTVPLRKSPPLGVWWRDLPAALRGRLKLCATALLLITLAFAQPLYGLARHAARSDVHSHILLIPFVSAYLLALRRERLERDYEVSPIWSIVLVAIGLSMLALRGVLSTLSRNDELSLTTLGYVSFVGAAGFAILGRRWMASAAFPVAFLLFMAPLPDAVVDLLETASRLGSAEVAYWFFELTGTPNLRTGTVFQLPTITLQVAQECSGIRSSLVLFITALIAGEMFLKSPLRRLVFLALVIPLGIVRNAFRILVIGMLCVHVGPEMIDSAIHRHGGPLFFVLSVIVLGLVLWVLRRQEARTQLLASQVGES